MYGDASAKLIHHAKRTQTLPTLPPYPTELVTTITREVLALDNSVSNLLAPFGGSFNPTQDAGIATQLLVDYMCMRRNKRCLLAYHRVRTQRIEESIWKGADLLTPQNETGHVSGLRGPSGPGAGAEARAEEAGSNLSPEEEEYARQYADLLAAYKGKWTDVDLTGSLDPPRDLFIDVRVLKDAGEIQTEYGAITLTKNSQFYVRQGDVERLIAQGYLQKLS
ncbi:DNA replication protein psf1 [Venturia effusa]|uniref:DNA replication complex GINS protein PSF1 n=1 Tax=Venturia effusa TaxID=50376 RepID=A0A517LG70_9PEZI|nr:DNA replication protein psf1 [Venturia effusa]